MKSSENFSPFIFNGCRHSSNNALSLPSLTLSERQAKDWETMCGILFCSLENGVAFMYITQNEFGMMRDPLMIHLRVLKQCCCVAAHVIEWRRI